jgi:hypothetical protein
MTPPHALYMVKLLIVVIWSSIKALGSTNEVNEGNGMRVRRVGWSKQVDSKEDQWRSIRSRILINVG